MIPLVVALSVGLYLVVASIDFAIATNCTNAWNCTSSGCSPCRVVSLAAFGGLVIGALLGAGALLSPWPRRARTSTYAIAMVATAVLTLVVMGTWTAPQ